MIVVKEGEEAESTMGGAMVKLEATLLAKVDEVQGKIQRTEDAGELQKLSTALSELLNSLEKIKKMKKS